MSRTVSLLVAPPLIFLILLGTPVVAEATTRITAPIYPESDGCPPPGGLAASLTFPVIDASGLFQIPATEGEAHLVIPCIQFDRSGYRVGQLWGATMTVTNVGSGASTEFDVYAQLCRHMADGVAFTCSVGVFPLASDEPALDPGESRVITHNPAWGFTELELDSAGLYESLVPGLPDNGWVYLRTSIPGTGEYSVASAIYPTGPELTAPPPPGSVDADEDGYTTPEDCNDANPLVHPGAPEGVNDGIDQDCASGDPGETSTCPGGSVIYDEICWPNYPGRPVAPAALDLDGDGYSTDEGDCDDSQYLVHPGAIEVSDGLDNNCNGMIDEAGGEPDFTLEVSAGPSTASYPGIVAAGEWGLTYSVEVQNVGGQIPASLDSIQAVTVEVDAVGGPLVVASGTSGFIPYRFIPLVACESGVLRFRLADNGIYGETRFDNNLVEWTRRREPGGADLDITFATGGLGPWAIYLDGPRLGVAGQPYATGDCPPLAHYANEDDIVAHHRVWVNGGLVHDETTFNDATYLDLADDLHRRDRVCAEVALNEPRMVAEPAANNGWVGAYEFRNPLLGPSRLDLVESAVGNPDSLSCTAWSAGESDTPIVGAVGGSLSGASRGSAPTVGGLGGAFVLGALGAGLGWLVGRRFGGVPVVATAAAGGLAGVVVGGMVGVGLMMRVNEAVGAQYLAEPRPDPVAAVALLSCDAVVDPNSASPSGGTAYQPGEHLVFDVAPFPSASTATRYDVAVHTPDGRTLAIPWPAESGDPPPLDIVRAAYVYPSAFEFPPGPYTWSVAAGFDSAGSAICSGSTEHGFVIETKPELPGSSATAATEPTATPTSTATSKPGAQPVTPTSTARAPTSTPSPTAPPADTSGPSIKSVADSPDPIKVTQPKGCSPNASIVSASISDPSGVASASVLFFHTTIGQVPMTNTGGNTWTATLGPYSGTGDGTADYQIHAVDSLGNATDSPIGQVAVLACLP